jgi:hypothetical protein
MSQIGRLLQGGILGGAQAYEDAARLHLAQEQARRDAQFDPVRMQNLQAELADRQARAERQRRGEAATKLGFDALRGFSAPMSPGQAGPVQPPVRSIDMFDAQTLADMDESVRTRLLQRDQDADAFNRKMAENKTLAESARAYGLFPHLGREAAMELVTSGFATIDEFAKNPAFRDEVAERDTDTKQGLITLLTVELDANGNRVFNPAAGTKYAGMGINQLRAELAVKEKFQAEQAAAAQAAQQQAALTAQAQQLGIDPSLAGIMTGAQLGEIAQRRAMPAASGSNSARNNGIAESIEARARALESQLIKSPSPELESQVQMLRAAETAARAGDVLPDGGVVLFGGQDVGGGFARVMQPNGQIISVDARLVQQSMGASGAGAATAQPSPDLDAAAISAFTQRFGVPPDPSNPQHVDAFAEIEAQLQSPR